MCLGTLKATPRIGEGDSANPDGAVIAMPLGPCNLADPMGLEVSVVGKGTLQSLWASISGRITKQVLGFGAGPGPQRLIYPLRISFQDITGPWWRWN